MTTPAYTEAFLAATSSGVNYVVKADLSSMVRVSEADAAALATAGYAIVDLSDDTLAVINALR